MENEQIFNDDRKDFMTIAKERLGIQPMTVKIKKLDERAVIPTYAHNGDVCMDMTAISVEYNVEKDMYIYHTGLAFESEFNIGQFLFLRSSNCNTDAYLCNGVGIADSAIYRGEIQFRFKNRESLEALSERIAIKDMMFSLAVTSRLDPTSKLSKHIEIASELYEKTKKETIERAKNLEFAPYTVGDRVGQMVFLVHPSIKLEIREELSETDRGQGGFGSTNK